MQAWKKQEPFRILRSVSKDLDSIFSSPSPVVSTQRLFATPATPALTPSVSSPVWTPENIATTIKWGIVDDTSSKNIVHVRARQLSGHILAARVGKNDVLDKVKGWRIMQSQVSDVVKVLLVPTSATRSKRHWYLDETESIHGQKITWRRAGQVMKWVPLPSTLRESTMRRKVDRQVSFLSPALSPPLRKKSKLDKAVNNGCKCSLGSPCKRLRLETAAEGRLPHCQPRLAKFPSTKKVFLHICIISRVHICTRTARHIHMHTLTYTYTHSHTRTRTNTCIYTLGAWNKRPA